MLKIRNLILAALLLYVPASSLWAQGTISAMTAASALSGTELFECVQSGSKKCTADQIKTFTSGANTFTGHQLFSPDNTYDIGASGATRPRAGYFGTSVNAGAGASLLADHLTLPASGYLLFTGTGVIQPQANGVFKITNAAETDFSRLQLGGTTSSFPAIKRSAATIAFRLADDSADAGISAGAGTFSGVVSLPAGDATTPSLNFTNSGTGFHKAGTNGIGVTNNTVPTAYFTQGVFRLGTTALSFASGGLGSSDDVFVRSGVAATVHFGAADVAGAPVAQTTRVQSASGVSNTAGADWTHQASAGTGTGAGGSHIFQVAPASTTSSTKNAYATALTIASTKIATFESAVRTTNNGEGFTVNVSAQPVVGIGRNSSVGGLNLYGNGVSDASSALVSSSGVFLPSTAAMGFASGSVITTIDSSVSRISAGVIGIGTGAAGSFAGTLKLTTLQGGTSVTVDNASAGTFTFGANAVTPASSGTRYLCISTAGVVTSSASACSGT